MLRNLTQGRGRKRQPSLSLLPSTRSASHSSAVQCLHSDLGGLHQGAPATAQQGRAGRGRGGGRGWSALSEHLLGCVDHVEEAVLVVVVLVNLPG